MGMRQEKFAKQVQRDMGELFQQHRHEWLAGEFVTISGVKASPDLGQVKVYLSLFNATQRNVVMENVELYAREIRMELAKKLKNQVKKIPEIVFFQDETLDYVNKMDKLFEEIHKSEIRKEPDSEK